MAAKKTKKPAKKPAAGRASKALATALAAVAPELAGTNPDQPVDTFRAYGKRIGRLAKPVAAKLKKFPGFQSWWIDELPGALDALEAAEELWADVRSASRAGVSPKRVKAAEALKSSIFKTGRYMLRDDAVAQQRLDEIADGTGVADTAADLRALAAMIGKYPAAFAADEDLPKDAAAQALAFAEELEVGTDPTAGNEAQAARNRAFWVADTAVREVRDGLKFLWKNNPEKLADLGVTYAAQVKRGQRKAAGGAGKQGGPQPKPQG